MRRFPPLKTRRDQRAGCFPPSHLRKSAQSAAPFRLWPEVYWNTNLLNNSALLGTLGFSAAQITGIANDYPLTIYLLPTVGERADSTYASLHGFARLMEKSALGTAAVPWPTLPTWPATPLAQPGVPEQRQYQLLAMQNDVVIGLPSPILTVVVS